MNVEEIKYDNEHILFVDDEKFVGDPFVKMLQHIGFQAEFANNGYDALKRLDEKFYTFLITDIKMPGMDGLELIKQTKTKFPQVSTIAMTGYAKDYSYMDVIDLGASDFINKPFNIEELEAKIKRIIIERETKKRLEQLSITDSLTQLYNQRHFHTSLCKEVMRAYRQNHPLSLIFLDLDGFKQYNDTFGHLEGDKLLQKVGGIINRKIRQDVDSGYRYGGDEFAIILVNAGQGTCEAFRKRIVTSIREECNVGVSAAHAQLPIGFSPNGFLAKVDELLYKAKTQKKIFDGFRFDKICLAQGQRP